MPLRPIYPTPEDTSVVCITVFNFLHVLRKKNTLCRHTLWSNCENLSSKLLSKAYPYELTRQLKAVPYTRSFEQWLGSKLKAKKGIREKIIAITMQYFILNYAKWPESSFVHVVFSFKHGVPPWYCSMPKQIAVARIQSNQGNTFQFKEIVVVPSSPLKKK